MEQNRLTSGHRWCDGRSTGRYPAVPRDGHASPRQRVSDHERGRGSMTSVVPERDLARPGRRAWLRPAARSGAAAVVRQRHPVAAPARPAAAPAGRGRSSPSPSRPPSADRSSGPSDTAVLDRRASSSDRDAPTSYLVLGPALAVAWVAVAALHPDLRRPGPRGRRRRVPAGGPGQRLLLGPGRDRQLHGQVPVLPVRARAGLPARDLHAAAAAGGVARKVLHRARRRSSRLVAPGARGRRPRGGRRPGRRAGARALRRPQGRRRLHAAR